MTTEAPATKSGFIAIVGKANVGKSSLLNAIIGEKIAIVSDKPQTTRTRITGILTKGPTQLVFIDTPGMHKPRTRLSEYMVKQVKESVSDVDLTVLVVEAKGPLTTAEEVLVDSFSQRGSKVIAAINKIDLLKNKEIIIRKMELLAARYNFEHIVPISAVTGNGVSTLVGLIETYAGEGPHYFDDDAITDQPEKVIAAEIVREKLLRNMREEVPHGTAVIIERFAEREDQEILDIDALIYCERDSHKGMIIGKNGDMLKRVATHAREDMEKFFQIKVNLTCWVKVKEDWRNRESIMRSLGYQ